LLVISSRPSATSESDGRQAARWATAQGRFDLEQRVMPSRNYLVPAERGSRLCEKPHKVILCCFWHKVALAEAAMLGRAELEDGAA